MDLIRQAQLWYGTLEKSFGKTVTNLKSANETIVRQTHDINALNLKLSSVAYQKSEVEKELNSVKEDCEDLKEENKNLKIEIENLKNKK